MRSPCKVKVATVKGDMQMIADLIGIRYQFSIRFDTVDLQPICNPVEVHNPIDATFDYESIIAFLSEERIAFRSAYKGVVPRTAGENVIPFAAAYDVVPRFPGDIVVPRAA